MSFARNGPEGIKAPHASLAFAKQKPTCSLLPCSTFPISHCHASPHTRSRSSREKQNLVGLTVSSLPKASFWHSQSSLQQLLGSRARWRRAQCHLTFWEGIPTIPRTRSPAADEAWKVTARELHPPVPKPQPPPAEPWVCSAQVQSLGSPGTFSLDPFTGIQGGTAVLSARKGRMIKAAKQPSKRVILSSAPACALSTGPLFRNFTKRKSESYFRCMAEKLPPFQRN